MSITMDSRTVDYMNALTDNIQGVPQPFTKHKPKEIVVPNRELILGNTAPDYSGRDVSIPLYNEEGKRERITIFIVAPPGKGKTKLLKTIMYQLHYNIGDGCIVLCDPRMEQMDARNLPPPPHTANMPTWYVPRSMPTKTYIPYYCVNQKSKYMFQDKKIKQAIKFKFNIGDMELGDMYTLLELHNEDDETQKKARWALEKAWTSFDRRYPESADKTIDKLLDCINNLPVRDTSKNQRGFASVTTLTLEHLVDLLKTRNVLGSLASKGINPVQDILNGEIPVISNMDSLSASYDSTYAAATAKKAYDERRKIERDAFSLLRHKPIWYLGDELQNVAFTGSEYARFIISLIARSGRVSLHNFIGVTQMIVPPTGTSQRGLKEEVDRGIPNQCENIISFKLNSPEDIAYICGIKQLDDDSIFRRIKSDKYSWVSQAVLFNENNKPQLFYPLPLMAGHRFEGG